MKQSALVPWFSVAFVGSVLFASGACSSSSSPSGGQCTPAETQACTCTSGATGTATCDASGSFQACSCPSSGNDASTPGNDAATSGNDASSGSEGGMHCPGCGDGGGPDDSSFEAGSANDAGLFPFGHSCTMASDCQSNDCFDFNAKGMFCTQPCSTGADCPNPPNLGCSGMGQCKVQ